MSEQLLDLAVAEVCHEFSLSKDHFLRDRRNIEAVKKMISGDCSGVAPEKTWLFSLVNNKRSGANASLSVLHVCTYHSGRASLLSVEIVQ
jgi:hypothetical protein